MARSNRSNPFIDDSIRYPRETMNAVRVFARSKPWRGTREERVAKFQALHKRLCAIYSVDTRLVFDTADETTSVYSGFSRKHNAILLSGRLSVVTYLHCFAYAIECTGPDVVKWSTNLFRRRFPLSYSRLRWVGHLLVKKTEQENYRPVCEGVVEVVTPRRRASDERQAAGDDGATL